MSTQEILLIVFSGLVTLSTIVYAILTWRLVNETKKMRKAQTEPRVEVRIEPREEWINLLELVVKNTGMGPASNIRFLYSPISLVPGSQSISQGTEEFIGLFNEIVFLQTGLEYLGPGQEVRTFFTSMAEDSEIKLDASVQVVALYEGPSGDHHENKYPIHMDEFKGLQQIGRPPLHKIAQSIEKIERNVGHFASGLRRIKVDSYSSEDREEEQAELEERFAERRAAAEEESDSS